MMWGPGLQLWKSGKQPVLSVSTAESELIELMEGACCGEAVRVVVEEIMSSRVRAISFCDNAASVTIVTSDSGSWRARHLRKRAHVLRGRVGAGHWAVRFQSGLENPSDLGTKIISVERFRMLKEMMGMFEADERSERTEKKSDGTQKGGSDQKRLAIQALILVTKIAQAKGSTAGIHHSYEDEMTPGIAQLILVVGGVFLVIGLLIGLCLTLCWDKMWTRVGESFVRPAVLGDEERFRNQVRSFSRGTGFRLGEETSSSATQVRREDGASSLPCALSELLALLMALLLLPRVLLRALSELTALLLARLSPLRMLLKGLDEFQAILPARPILRLPALLSRAERAHGPAAGAADASSNAAGRAERAQGPAAGVSTSSSSSTAAGTVQQVQRCVKDVKPPEPFSSPCWVRKSMWIDVVMDYVKPR